jgi:hypothetical protein
MTFTDLPANWTELPLTDPDLAGDVVDLQLTLGERRSGVVSAILCDQQSRFLTSIQLEVPDYADDPPDVCEEVLEPVIPVLQNRTDGALLLALGRPGPPAPLPVDLAWAQAVAQLCQTAEVRLLAFYIATPTHVYRPTIQPAVAA